MHPLGKLGLPGNSLEELQLLCDARTMRELDRNAIENIGIPGMVLMENAARSFTDLLEQEILSKNPEQMVVVCCGKGNNGGDGFVIARHLDYRGYTVRVLLFAQPDSLQGDAAINHAVIQRSGIEVKQISNVADSAALHSELTASEIGRAHV